MKQQQQLEKTTDITPQQVSDAFVYTIATRYMMICQEVGVTWFGYERDCLVSAEKTCLKSGNYTK